MELCLRARRAGIPTLLRPDVVVRHLGGASTSRALADRDLDLRAQRRREVVAQEGRLPLLVDDVAEGLTFGLRGAAKALVGGGQLERRRLGALLRARR
jgi:N-acetylglucosaminyl-diphospho-decaprenol L-rhamnosyltransferase